ncbi:tetratricopeptide repeat protein [Neobacillus sp. SAB-20_R2A]|uniref:tetratricopeptide repeat protein n=1 Tax=Neobacillus sp. SAB-20_R2A TaxID=3120519 RepID=UPI003C6E1BAA
MAIQPKFQLGRQERRYIATKQFTDREFPREVFAKRVERIIQRPASETEHDVVMYYGVGGIGKSSLQRQLKLELLTQVPNALYTSIDFMNNAIHSPARALLELVRETKFKHKIHFPHFEIAYSLYFFKRNPDISYNEKQLPFKSELNIIGSVVAALDGLGVVGAAAGIIEKLYDTKKKWNLNKDVKEQLKELESCSLQEIEDRLPAFFSFDLQQGIAKHHIPVSVIFIDTYEALWTDVKNEATKYTKDGWVRELIALLPNVLFVICGREYLEWEIVDQDWKEIVEHHILGNLDSNNADYFLQQCGIEEEEIREKMIHASSGHPYHLDLSVDTYFEIKNRGESLHPDQFGSNKREILDRFLRYLSDEEIETLKIMAIPHYYNRDVFVYLLSHFKTGYPITKFADFNKFSFITKEQQNYYIHALMREGILNYTSPELVQQVHELMAHYYEDLLKNNQSLLSNNEKEISVLEENIYHKKSTLSNQQFVEWLERERITYLKKYQLRGEIRFLKNLLGNIYDDIGSKNMNTPLFAILIDMIHLSGEYERAVDEIENYYDGTPMEDIIKSKDDLHLTIRKVHHQMYFKPVKPLIDKLLHLEPLISESYEEEYNETLFMLGGNLGVLHGDLSFSRKWLVKSIRYAQATGRANYLCRTLRKYADVLRLKGHIKWAKICTEYGIKIARENGFDRYESYLLCTLGDILRTEEDYEKAAELFEQSSAIIKRHGIKGWEGHVNSSLAEMAFQKGNYADAAKFYSYANKIYLQINQQWGIIVSSLGLLRCKLKGIEVEVPAGLEEITRNSDYLNYLREQELTKNMMAGESPSAIQLIFL